MNTILDRFLIEGEVCIITGGAGLLGKKHAAAILSAKGIPVLLDISLESLAIAKKTLEEEFPNAVIEIYQADITNYDALCEVRAQLQEKYGHIDILINNAANNPKVESKSTNMENIRFDNFPLKLWQDDLAVGLTGAFLCSQVFGEQMEKQQKGVVLNISSDLGIIAPDQRIYQKEGLIPEEQSIKPITYSVIKHGLIGMTKYLATYWCQKGIRVNTICPAGVENGQNEEFMKKLTNLIPMGRMASAEEYQCTVLYMISEASSYMTGSTVIVDGGRTCW